MNADALFKLATICFAGCVLCTWLLRMRLDGDEILLRALFANPVMEGQRESGRLLRVKFFWPFTSAPAELYEYASALVMLFWAARLMGFGFASSMAAFFVSLFLQASA
jgi:hypothetical protein